MLFLLLVVQILLVGGCTTDFEVYAPDKEIRSVYCVLNPRDTVQYVRIAKAFQVKGDAVQYAGANDFSVKGLRVQLKMGSKTWTAREVPNVPKDSGAFLPLHTVYAFSTRGSDSLPYDRQYTLEIGTPDAPGYVTGTTNLPPVPKVRGDLNSTSGAGNTICLPRLALERRFAFVWKALAASISYEVRVGLNFEANGISDSTLWGPSELLSSERKCNAQECSFIFEAKQLLGKFATAMPLLPQTSYTYDTRDSCAPANLHSIMPRSLWFEVTAVDQYLSNYMTVNDPSTVDLNGTKPEYTNLTGNLDVIGIFGSYHTDRRYAILQACSAYLLGLNGVSRPVNCSW